MHADERDHEVSTTIQVKRLCANRRRRQSGHSEIPGRSVVLAGAPSVLSLGRRAHAANDLSDVDAWRLTLRGMEAG